MRNQKLREEMKRLKVYHWELAEYMGVSEMTITKRLRYELPESEAEKFRAVALKIAASKKN